MATAAAAADGIASAGVAEGDAVALSSALAEVFVALAQVVVECLALRTIEDVAVVEGVVVEAHVAPGRPFAGWDFGVGKGCWLLEGRADRVDSFATSLQRSWASCGYAGRGREGCQGRSTC